MLIIINNIKLGLLITATLITLLSGCGKDKNSSKPCSNGRYSFKATSNFSPQQEVYNLNDTIYFTSSIPKTLYDNVSLNNIDYQNSLGIGGTLSFSILDTVNSVINYGLNKFKVVDFIGTSTQLQNANILNAGKNILFYESNNIYEVKIAIILNNKGLFMLGADNLGSQGLKGKDCTNAGFDMTVTNTNKNINLFQYAVNYTPDALLQKSIYCFRVR